MKSRSNRIAAGIPAFAGTVAFLCVSAAASRAQDVKVAPTPRPPTVDIKTPPPVLPPKDSAPPIESTHGTQTASQPVEMRDPSTVPALIAPAIDPNAVYFDAPGDGSLWAYGARYKARFDGAGATYIPFLGSSAPQSYPVTFHLARVEIGGQPLSVQDGVSATLSGTTVSFDRGSLVEKYLMRPGSMEQVFVLDTLPGSGDLVVRIDVATELSRSESSEGFRFANALGHVNYGRAVAFDATGDRVSAATTLDGGSVEIRVPASFLAGATLPLTIDPVVDTFTVTSSTADDYSPDIAYDATNDRYLVCFERVVNQNDHDVWVQQHDAAGVLVAGSITQVDGTTDYWARPRCASNNIADQYLVVAEVGDPSSGARIIRGRTRDAASATMGAQFTISGAEAGDKLNPDVGGDPSLVPPTYYCVVWERVVDAADHDVHGNLVLSDSTLLGGTILIDNSTGTLDNDTSVSKSDGQAPSATQNWTVTWRREFSLADNDIWGAQLLWDGSITHASYTIDSTTANDFLPQASSLLDGASGERDYLVTYQRGEDIHARIMNGVTLMSDGNVSELEDNGFIGQKQRDPTTDSDGKCYAIVYSERIFDSPYNFDTFASTISRNGTAMQVKERHASLSFGGTFDGLPQITSTYSGGGAEARFAVVWYRTSPDGSVNIISGGLYDCDGFVSYCWPGSPTSGAGAIACPCANPPSPSGRGCDNSDGTGGAILTMTGTPDLSTDDVVFTASGEKATATSFFLQGDAASFSGLVFGMGVRCVAGNLKRLYVKSASGGVVTAPVGADPSVSARSAALGDLIPAGSSRYYNVAYRDPVVLGGCPVSSTFNATQSGALLWTP